MRRMVLSEYVASDSDFAAKYASTSSARSSARAVSSDGGRSGTADRSSASPLARGASVLRSARRFTDRLSSARRPSASARTPSVSRSFSSDARKPSTSLRNTPSHRYDHSSSSTSASAGPWLAIAWTRAVSPAQSYQTRIALLVMRVPLMETTLRSLRHCHLRHARSRANTLNPCVPLAWSASTYPFRRSRETLSESATRSHCVSRAGRTSGPTRDQAAPTPTFGPSCSSEAQAPRPPAPLPRGRRCTTSSAAAFSATNRTVFPLSQALRNHVRDRLALSRSGRTYQVEVPRPWPLQ